MAAVSTTGGPAPIEVFISYSHKDERLQGAPFGRLQALPKNGRPITKWADKDEAFTDVARGIQGAVEEIRTAQASVPGARSQRLPPIWNVPAGRNSQFTGREDLIEEVHRQVARGPVALTAGAGMGKTQLALEYTYRHAADFDLVWWLRAEEPTTLREDYAALATELDLEEAGERKLEVVTFAVRRELARRPGWLLVFDNATAPKDVLPLVPEGEGRIVVTSRQPDWPFASIAVSPLSRLASIQLLLGVTGQGDREAADALAGALEDQPLALEKAAAFVHETKVSLAEYLEAFRRRRAA